MSFVEWRSCATFGGCSARPTKRIGSSRAVRGIEGVIGASRWEKQTERGAGSSALTRGPPQGSESVGDYRESLRPPCGPLDREKLRKKKVWPPVVLNFTGEVAKKHDVTGPKRLALQLHLCLIGRGVAFLVVARYAGGNQVFPRVASPA